jgi:hypothetical protein
MVDGAVDFVDAVLPESLYKMAVHVGGEAEVRGFGEGDVFQVLVAQVWAGFTVHL